MLPFDYGHDNWLVPDFSRPKVSSSRALESVQLVVVVVETDELDAEVM